MICTPGRTCSSRGRFEFGVRYKILCRLVIQDDEAGILLAVIALVNVEDGVAPTDIRRNRDVVGLLDPELATTVDNRNPVFLRIFVGPLYLDAIIILAIAKGAKHPVVDGLAFEQYGHQAISQSDQVRLVRLKILLLLANAV